MLTFALQTANLTIMDLEEIDALLRPNRQGTRRGTSVEKTATGEDVLVGFANVAYDGSPDNHRRATRLVRLLGCFSTQGKPLAPDLSCDQVCSRCAALM